MSAGAARAMQAPGWPARDRAECPDLGGQRLDRNRADGRAIRRLSARSPPIFPSLSVMLLIDIARCRLPTRRGVIGLEVPPGRGARR